MSGNARFFGIWGPFFGGGGGEVWSGPLRRGLGYRRKCECASRRGVLSGFARILGYLCLLKRVGDDFWAMERSVGEGGFGAAGRIPIFLGPGCLAQRARWQLAPRLACLVASLLVSHSFFQKRSERRLSFRLCDPGEPPQPEVAGGSGRRVLSRGLAARWSRAAMVHDCARSPSRWMSTFESRPKTRLCGHRLLCDSRR